MQEYVAGLPDAHSACKWLASIASQEATCRSRKADRPLILYGAGSLGKMAKEFFERLGIHFLYVVDMNPARYEDDTAWNGISIIEPQDVPQEHRSGCMLAICVVTASFASISAPLLQQGWLDVVPFYDIAEAYSDRYPLGNGWFAGTLNAEDTEGIEYVLNHWDDNVSIAHHLQFIAWHRLRKEVIFDGAPISTDDRFVIPQIVSVLHEREIFLDGGAHYGDVSQRFMDIVHNTFTKIYAIEPDKHNVAVLRSRFSIVAGASRNIEIIECALGSKSGKSPFLHGLGYASQFSSASEEYISVQTLDEMHLPITFLKLHLEGWEYDALAGSITTLTKYRPIVTVTTYHNRKGLWMLPAFLMQNLHDYTFLMRLHCWMGTGAVIYAIPRERYLR